MKAVLRRCLVCAKKNAQPQWSLPTSVAERVLHHPPFSRIAVDHLHLEKTIVLSVCCIDTGVVSLIHCSTNSTNLEDAVSALRRLIFRYSLNLLLIHSDSASTFLSPKFAAMLRAIGQSPEFSTTTPGAPYTNPVERCHREVLSVIRTSKFKRLCIIGPSPQDSLDEIASILNQRPVGHFESDGREAVLTPALLAWGSPYTACTNIELRRYFYDICFQGLRRVGQVNRHVRRGNVLVGQRALLYNPAATKLSAPFELCRIVDIQGSYLIVNTTDGRTKKVGSNQLAPLDISAHSHQSPPSPYDVSRIGCRISASFEDARGQPEDYSGIVVREYGDLVEVEWAAHQGKSWNNELIPWGACRVIQ